MCNIAQSTEVWLYFILVAAGGPRYEYVQEHLRILSGFYGVVRPLDGVVPYRLEMKSKIDVAGCHTLYEYWGDDLYNEVMDDSRILINLASKEYSKSIEKYLTLDDR